LRSSCDHLRGAEHQRYDAAVSIAEGASLVVIVPGREPLEAAGGSIVRGSGWPASSTIRTGGSSASSSRTPTTGNVLGPSGIVSPGPQLGTALVSVGGSAGAAFPTSRSAVTPGGPAPNPYSRAAGFGALHEGSKTRGRPEQTRGLPSSGRLTGRRRRTPHWPSCS
jgi:hypothetical protein